MYLLLDLNRNVIYLFDVYRDMLLCVLFMEKFYWESKFFGKFWGICVVGNNIIVVIIDGKLCVLFKDGNIVKIMLSLGYDFESLVFDDVI